MKFLTSILLALSAEGTTLCAETGHSLAEFEGSLIVPVCDEAGFTISIDETCRAAEYDFIDFENSAFVHGDETVIEKPVTACSPTSPTGDVAEWAFVVAYGDCEMADPAVEAAGDDGIAWNVYTLYLNFDTAITSGSGSFQSLGQTMIQCKIPANIQENSLIDSVVVNDVDPIPDVTAQFAVWEKLELAVYTGGTAKDAVFSADPVESGSSIDLGEHVKLEVVVEDGSATTFNIAIESCWASTIENKNEDAVDGVGISWDATGDSGAYNTAMFYNNQCPLYPWVFPIYGLTTGTTSPVSVDDSPIVTLRQFAFADATDSFEGFYYHCELTICLPGVDCVADDLQCDDVSYDAPMTVGRRRRHVVSSKIVNREERSATTVVSTNPGKDSPKLKIGKSCFLENYGNVDVCSDVIRKQAVTSAASDITIATVMAFITTLFL